MPRGPLLTQERIPLTPAEGGVRPECAWQPQSWAEVAWLPLLTSLSPGVLAYGERPSDRHRAQKGAKSPQDGGGRSSIWEMSGKIPRRL